MKLSEFIKRLQATQQMWGDVDPKVFGTPTTDHQCWGTPYQMGWPQVRQYLLPNGNNACEEEFANWLTQEEGLTPEQCQPIVLVWLHE